MNKIVFFDHSFIPENEACISISDRGFLFGDGAFTTIKVCSGLIECYSLHCERLKRHCRELNIIPPEINSEWIKELIVKNDAKKGKWRLKIMVTGGADRTLSCEMRLHGHLIMTLSPYQDELEKELHLVLYPHPVIKPLSKVKNLAYLDRLWIKKYAIAQGRSDALVLDENGFILETAFSNVFWRIGTDIFSPDPSLPLLEGIAIHLVEETAAAMQLNYRPVRMRLDEIPNDAQLFVCNSLKGVCPVTSINERLFNRDFTWENLFCQEYKKLINIHSVEIAKSE